MIGHGTTPYGDKEGRSAFCRQIQPFAVGLPIDLSGDAYAVCVAQVEASLLGHTESHGVDTVIAGAAPLDPAGIVAGALGFEKSRSQMTHGVAADDDRILPGLLTDGRVKVFNDLCRRPRPVMKYRQIIKVSILLPSPFADDVKGSKVVFDQLIAPVFKTPDIFPDQIDHGRHRRVKGIF